LIALGGTLGWDESAHALYGLLIAHDLSQHDWISLLYDTYRQVYWPPLYSWLAGLLFLFTGRTTAACPRSARGWRGEVLACPGD